VHHAPHTVQTVNQNQLVILASMVSKCNRSVTEVSQPVTVFKNVEMEEDFNLIVTMETTRMEMDVQLIVKFRLDGFVPEVQA